MNHPDHRGDGDGWVECSLGHRHWGRFGAAGLLAHRARPDGSAEVLLQHRAEWSHHGGTWGLLGGARASHESPLAGALREAAEEGGVDPTHVHPDGQYDDDHGGWAYVTIIARAVDHLDPRPTGGESIDVVWWPVDRLGDLQLHPGFAESWPVLRDALTPLSVVVDVANVMGSRPDGWWRDRAGAAQRLLTSCATLARGGVPGSALPEQLPRAPLAHWWPHVSGVLEGAARSAAQHPPDAVEVVVAPGSGDDAIVAHAAVLTPPKLVVTADRELRRRCADVGAVAVGPRWLLDLVEQPR
ncbi:MAG: 8-oxo-dGTP diphosphatase [Actinomycetota bacterium]|jgi:8-oxo-dGTP pyrophosphatase MutT (NUDIX family)|nr:8-oxo-dGTP diphosphatase [Actinomycetota bacterium]